MLKYGYTKEFYKDIRETKMLNKVIGKFKTTFK